MRSSESSTKMLCMPAGDTWSDLTPTDENRIRADMVGRWGSLGFSDNAKGLSPGTMYSVDLMAGQHPPPPLYLSMLCNHTTTQVPRSQGGRGFKGLYPVFCIIRDRHVMTGSIPEYASAKSMGLIDSRGDVAFYFFLFPFSVFRFRFRFPFSVFFRFLFSLTSFQLVRDWSTSFDHRSSL